MEHQLKILFDTVYWIDPSSGRNPLSGGRNPWSSGRNSRVTVSYDCYMPKDCDDITSNFGLILRTALHSRGVFWSLDLTR